MCTCSPESIKQNDERRDWWFQPAFQGYVEKSIGENRWRLHEQMAEDDVRQELFFTFDHILHIYPAIQEPKHAMAMFKQACAWFWDVLSVRLSKQAERSVEYSEAMRDVATSESWLDFESVLMRLPGELAEMVVTILSEPVNKLGFRRRKAKPGKVGRRETNNQRLCRLAKADPRTQDLDTPLRAMFGYLQ